MRTDLQRLIGKRLQMGGFHMNDAILILQHAFREDELAAGDNA
jgi:hypothetical protein